MATSPVMEDSDNELNITDNLNMTSTKHYDAHGAMLFTVATVLVYGMSIVAFIAGHLRRRHHSKEEESQISKYLKRADDIRRQGVRDDVLKLRSQLLAGSVIVNCNNQNIERRKSRVERAKQYILNDINCVNIVTEEERRPSLESLILPACTVPRPCPGDSESSLSTDLTSPRPDVNISPPPEAEECQSEEDDECEDGNVEETQLFIQNHGGGLPRKSLHASLEQSVMNTRNPETTQTDKEDSPEGSPDFNASRNYRSRRRGVVLTEPFVFQGSNS